MHSYLSNINKTIKYKIKEFAISGRNRLLFLELNGGKTMLKKIAVIRHQFLSKFLISLKRFPESLFLATSAAVLFIILNHIKYPETALRDILTRITMILGLGVPLFLCIRMVFERFPISKSIAKIACTSAAVIGLVLYYFFLLKNLTMVTSTRYTAVSIALYFVFLVVPYFYKRDRFELYVVKLLTRFAVTYLYSAILYLGLAAIIFTVNKLFSLGSYELYFDFWLIVAWVFAPAYFLADVPEYGQDLPSDDYPKLLKVLLLYIVMPMIVAYGAILYIYFAKIIISRIWPAGIVSHLVLWYSIISVSVIFLSHPLKNFNRWCAKFIITFPRFILPLLAMMFLALGIRIRAYGITENRYFVLIAGLWVTGCMVYFLFSKKPRNIVLPASVALIALLSVTGPWSCYSVSKFSQNARLTEILQKYDILKDNRISRPNHALPQSAQREISSILSYFDQFHQLRDIRYLPKNFEIKDMKSLFGFPLKNGYGRSENSYFYYQFTGNKTLRIRDYDYFVVLSNESRDITKTDNVIFRGQDDTLSYDKDYNFLITAKGQKIYAKNVLSLTTTLLGKNDNHLKSIKDLRYPDVNANVKVLYVFDNIRGFMDNETGEYKINYFNCYLFIKIKHE